MCGDSHLPPAPESKDLIAIIHPSSTQTQSQSLPIPQPLIRINSNCSTISTLSSSSTRSTSPTSIRGRLRLSNSKPGNTTSEFSYEDDSLSSLYDVLSVRIHKFGFPLQFGDGNPVMHEFSINDYSVSSSGMRLDLGVGGDGVIGRTVSIVDRESRVLGEGIIGRI